MLGQQLQNIPGICGVPGSQHHWADRYLLSRINFGLQDVSSDIYDTIHILKHYLLLQSLLLKREPTIVCGLKLYDTSFEAYHEVERSVHVLNTTETYCILTDCTAATYVSKVSNLEID